MTNTNEILTGGFIFINCQDDKLISFIRKWLADPRATSQLCHIARCDKAEVERQVERTGWDIHDLRAFYLANGEWPLRSKPIDKSV